MGYLGNHFTTESDEGHHVSWDMAQLEQLGAVFIRVVPEHPNGLILNADDVTVKLGNGAVAVAANSCSNPGNISWVVRSPDKPWEWVTAETMQGLVDTYGFEYMVTESEAEQRYQDGRDAGIVEVSDKFYSEGRSTTAWWMENLFPEVFKDMADD